MAPPPAAPALRPMTTAEFLAWEDGQEARHEFDGFGPVAMTGGTRRHDRITFGLHRALDRALRGNPCQPSGPNLKIVTAGGKVRYPDALVSCAPVAPDATVAEEPVVVFEVVSPGSARVDRVVKLREYGATPSIRRYVILEGDSAAATVLERPPGGGGGGAWIATAAAEGDTIPMPEVGAEIGVADIYEGVAGLAASPASEGAAEG